LRPTRLRILRNNALDHQELRTWRRRLSNGGENLSGLLIVPVVDDLHDEIAIGGGQRIDEEISGMHPQLFRFDSRILSGGRYMRLVEQHSVSSGRGFQDGGKQMTATAADVGDRSKG